MMRYVPQLIRARRMAIISVAKGDPNELATRFGFSGSLDRNAALGSFFYLENQMRSGLSFPLDELLF
jgi:hypothetical protein